MKRFVCTIALLIILFGCKPQKKDEVIIVPSQVSEVGIEKSAFVVENAANLPACTDKLEGAMVFVEDVKEFQSCKKGQWKTLEANVQYVQDRDMTDAWRQIWKDNIERIASVGVVWGDLLDRCPLLPEPSGRGTAFMVGENMLISAVHVVKQVYLLTLDWEGNDELKSQVTTNCQHLIKEQDAKKVVLTLALKKVLLWFPASSSGKTDYLNTSPTTEGTAVDLEIAATDDLALIQANTAGRTSLKISDRDEASESEAQGAEKPTGVFLGEPVMVLGYSSSTDYAHFVTGRINAQKLNRDRYFASIADDKMVYEYDAVTGTGASGGPVFDVGGQVIAIHFAADQTSLGTEFGYGIQIKHLRNLLQKERIWTPVPNKN